MANSRRNYICVTESGKVYKYASQSIGQIIDEKEDWQDPFLSISSIGLHDGIRSIFNTLDQQFEELEWHD